MQHPRFAALAALPLAALLLSACASVSHPADTPPVATDSHAGASTLPEYDREDYQARIDELSHTLLALREEGYIAKIEYEARIEALLKEIAALEARLALLTDPDAGGDLPVGGNPADTTPETDPNTRPSATMAFHYEIRDGSAVILSYLGSEIRVTIPAAIEGYPVTAIEDDAFRQTSVTEVTVPYSVTEIGWFAFADCTSLASVTLPASLESIGYGAFDGCPHLTLYCPADSYAADYAASFGLRHELT